MDKKKITVTLVRRRNALGEGYKIMKLVNTTTIADKQIGDHLTENEAQAVCDTPGVEVTITQAR
jgi:hypothetical protein